MILGAITGVPTPACLSATNNPVEAVTPPLGVVFITGTPVSTCVKQRSQMHSGTAKNFV